MVLYYLKNRNFTNLAVYQTFLVIALLSCKERQARALFQPHVGINPLESIRH